MFHKTFVPKKYGTNDHWNKCFMEKLVTGKFEMVFVKINKILILIYVLYKSLVEQLLYLFTVMCFGLNNEIYLIVTLSVPYKYYIMIQSTLDNYSNLR